MSRYIDADDVANAIYHHFPSIRTMADARGVIEEVPSIDIVFCKECKNNGKDDCPMRWWNDDWMEYEMLNDEEGFCNFGEREGE